MECRSDDPPTITGCVPTKDTNRNVNESFSTESDIDNVATNSLITNDNFDVKEKCSQANSSEKSVSSFSLMLEYNKLYRGIYGLILTDIPDV